MSFYVTQWSTETGRSPRVDNLRYSKWIQIRQRGFLFQYADITSANFVVIGLVWNKHQAIIWNSVEHFIRYTYFFSSLWSSKPVMIFT